MNIFSLGLSWNIQGLCIHGVTVQLHKPYQKRQSIHSSVPTVCMIATYMPTVGIRDTHIKNNNKKKILWPSIMCATYCKKVLKSKYGVKKIVLFQNNKSYEVLRGRSCVPDNIVFLTKLNASHNLSTFQDTNTTFLRNSLAFTSANCFSKLSPHIKQSTEHSFAKHI